MGAALFDLQTIQQPLQLSRSDLLQFQFAGWPAKAILLQPFIPHAEAVPVPIEDFQNVPATIAKHKQMSRERILIQHIADDQRQPIHGFTHIRFTHRQVYFQTRSWSPHHAFLKARTTLSRASSEQSRFTSTQKSPNKTRISASCGHFF